ncbi:MAG: amidohydrolase [Metallosphaera sp.]|uniref:amidohydrolase family protein n=1 Tax=Metallosphaera sp. TaxID=2020860 RepID=UPI00316A0B54
MRIQINAGLAFERSSVLRNVSIYIEGSKVVSISKSRDEEGFEDVELVLGGRERIVSPGFVSTHTLLSLYPFRYSIVSGYENANDLISSMTQNDVYHLSLLGAYHLLRSGVTTAVTADPFPETVARAMMKVGIRPIISVNVGCNWGPSDWKREFNVLNERWKGGDTKVILKLCDPEYAEEVIALSQETKVPVLVDRIVNVTNKFPPTVIAMGGGSRSDLSLIKDRRMGLSFLPSVEVCKFTLGSYSPSLSLDLSLRFDPRMEVGYAVSRLLLTPDQALRAISLWGYEQLSMRYPLELGSTPDLVVYQVNEPPYFPLDFSSPYETLIFSTGIPETVIVGGEPVLDGGSPLNVGMKDIEEAQEIIDEFRKTKSLEKG